MSHASGADRSLFQRLSLEDHQLGAKLGRTVETNFSERTGTWSQDGSDSSGNRA
jgi:hypothetical protein